MGKKALVLAAVWLLTAVLLGTAVVWAATNYLLVLEPGEHADLVCTSGVYSVAPHGEGVRFGCFQPVPPCDPLPFDECGQEGGGVYPVYLPVVAQGGE